VTRIPESVNAISVERLRNLLPGLDADSLIVPNHAGNFSIVRMNASECHSTGGQHPEYVAYIDMRHHMLVMNGVDSVREMSSDDTLDVLQLPPETDDDLSWGDITHDDLFVEQRNAVSA
jgi:hypothetical protein